MFIVDLSNPAVIILLLGFTVLLIILGREMKKSLLPAIALLLHIVLIIMHAFQFFMVNIDLDIHTILAKSLTMDFIFIFLSFISYLWIDDIQAKREKKKSIDNSLDWFWNKM